MTELPGTIQVSLAILVVLAAAYDLRYRRIPNWLTAAGCLWGFALQFFFRGWTGLREAGLGASLAFGVYFVLFALHAMGGGDVKLMTAVGALAGPANWLVIFVTASLVGGVLAVFFILLRGTLLRTVTNVLFVLGQLLKLRAPYREKPELDVAHPNAVTLPHAIPIAVGGLMFLLLARMQS